MIRTALWPQALELYGRPGAEALLLTLQDAHGQCVPFLLWAVWLAGSGRRVDAATLARGADLARAWQATAIGPLRDLRRDLKGPGGTGPAAARERLRQGVKALELEAERMLLQMLDELSPAPGDAEISARDMLERAVAAWGVAAPLDLLDLLADLAV